LLASSKVDNNISRCKKPYSIGEGLVLTAAVGILETTLCEPYAIEL
jgi:hypothetical protein